MHAVPHDLNAAETCSTVVAKTFVVIARDEDDTASLANLPEQLLQHVVMRLWPNRATFHPPEVDDIADQVIGVGIVVLQEVKKGMGLRRAGA